MRRALSILLKRMVGVHSPSAHMIGQCWCQTGRPATVIHDTIPTDAASAAPSDTEGRNTMTLITTDGREVNESRIAYDDADALRSLLIGQKILSITEITGKAVHKAEYKLEVAAWREAGSVGEKPYRSSYWGGRDEYDRVLQFHLDGGYALRAHAHDGGCGCTNGCFSVDIEAELRERLIGATILGLQVEERQTDTKWDDNYENPTETERVFIDGQPAEDGETVDTTDSSTITVFVYTDLITEKQPLVTSSGGDNGYYGWGFHFSVDRTIVVEESATKSVES